MEKIELTIEEINVITQALGKIQAEVSFQALLVIHNAIQKAQNKDEKAN